MFDCGAIDLCFLIDEGPKFTVKKIIFKGNQKIASSDLLAAIELKEASGTLYYERGMINIRISDPKIDIIEEDGHIVITFSIEEGPTFSIGKIGVSGDLVAEPKDYQAFLKIKTGETFVRSKVAADMQRIHDFHKKHGHTDLDVTPATNIDSERFVVDIIWQISKIN
ncbi:MAG: hypothetical protein JRJ87_16140 [Deltaproteobacteria bacterium]|nr:hypothetical protein [Deltaproteobacteria bacterium]